MKESVRLSSSVIPEKYDITIRPDLENFTFHGNETITLWLGKPTREITLHSKEIDIDTASLGEGDEKMFANEIRYNEKKETATFVFPVNISKGQIKLTIVFSGILNDKMRGFYRSQYFLYGEKRVMATTQFEATDARRAFPCFDEPAQKAVFHVSLIVPEGKTAISNTLPVSVKKHDIGFQVIRFSPTPKMSTYLLPFILLNF